jgi:phospholipase C
MVLLGLFAAQADAQITNFQHVIVIVQENRTPDNLFYALCNPASVCSTTPSTSQYDIQTANWANKAASNGVTQPVPVALAGTYDLDHSHTGFVRACDINTATGICGMDGSAAVSCSAAPGTVCPASPQFAYVDNSTGILNPYLALVKQYGWANYMFQTNQGPSFPAHQFIFGATSAPSAADDHIGTFASENVPDDSAAGCIAAPGTVEQLIDAEGVEAANNRVFPCFEHQTLADLLTANGETWRYYTLGSGSIWNAPNAIDHICQPSNQQCTGAAWAANVDQNQTDVLRDIASCNLRNVSWVTPAAGYSDHAGGNEGRGPSWVAAIVNAIGNSKCVGQYGKSYWQTTAILITWDDWGGWYDHEPPTILKSPQGGYQYGFRVPFIFVAAYRKPGYISNTRFDFGSIARFIEHNYSIPLGALTFADARTSTDLFDFYDLQMLPRTFQTIPAPYSGSYFLNDTSPQLPPDSD